MMLKRRFGLAAALLVSSAPLAHAAPPDPMGNWARNDGTSKITIAPCGTNICATNTWIKDPDSEEKVGDRLILTLKPVSADELDGDAHDERRNMNYEMRMTVQPTSLKTSGCILFGLLCKSAEWTRIP